MEKDKDVDEVDVEKEYTLNRDQFEIYYKMLLLNYSKKHTQSLYKMYYEFFKNETEEDFKNAVMQAIRNEKYFPNVAELSKHLPTQEEKKLRDWENVKSETVSEEEEKELKEMLKIWNYLEKIKKQS